MSRQDTTILNPLFAVEQTVQAMQLEYIEGYNIKSAKQRLTLDTIQEAVEKTLHIENLTKNTNAVPYPDARKLFVKVAYKNVSIDEGEIMGHVKRHRTSFYHNMTQAQNLIDTDKYYRQVYESILKTLGL